MSHNTISIASVLSLAFTETLAYISIHKIPVLKGSNSNLGILKKKSISSLIFET